MLDRRVTFHLPAKPPRLTSSFACCEPGLTAGGRAGWFPSTYVSDVRPIPAVSAPSPPAAIPASTASAVAAPIVEEPEAIAPTEQPGGSAAPEAGAPAVGAGDGESAAAPAGAGGSVEEGDVAPSGSGAGGGEQEELVGAAEAGEVAEAGDTGTV